MKEDADAKEMDDSILWDVIIVGAGVAGCSVAYHLHETGKKPQSMLIIDAGNDAGEGVAPRQSGSATMDDDVAPCIKMMVQIYAGSSREMIRHHGQSGAARYLSATKRGLEIQKSIAREIWRNEEYSKHIKELGSFYIGYDTDAEELKEEFETLERLGFRDDVEWYNKERLKQVDGLQSTEFECGIYFPKDAIIDSSLYAKSLLRFVLTESKGKAKILSNTTVQDLCQNGDTVRIKLDSEKCIRGKRVVVTTGAFFPDPNLNGIIKPCYSYLVHVPIPDSKCQCSANFFTWGFSHDWCYTEGKVRISGEDHFSAYKAPRARERCARLAEWTLRQYRCNPKDVDWAMLPQQYGLYSETPDMVPLVGPSDDNSRICYLLGCNAWGQTILSYCASLIPAILGYDEFSKQQADIFSLVSIRRFEELPVRTTTATHDRS